VAPVSWFARWFRLQGFAALVLATAGVLGLMRLWVEALRPELAIRRAVGARRLTIAAFVLARASFTGIRGVAVAVLFFGPFLWGELARLDPGTPTLPIPLVARYGALLAAAAILGALAPAVVASRRPPAADLG
jgi:ABC-type antimicrobial peptide transport system permease subunit